MAAPALAEEAAEEGLEEVLLLPLEAACVPARPPCCCCCCAWLFGRPMARLRAG